jgi:predicted short-subunit dehydrogenase-like oxidoreductase (DUF2520 family)
MQIPTLNIIGAGRLGQTLGRLFHLNQCFKINGVYNSSTSSTEQAVDFIGAGLICSTLDQLPAADVIMITTPDTLIEKTALALKKLSSTQQSKLVFHCSGATPSTVLSSLKNPSNSIASIHPNMTFASAKVSVDHFAGTYCAFEGEETAFELVENVFRKIGGHVFQITLDKKPLYHATTAMSCNQLVALMDISVELYLKLGISREIALAMMQPIVTQTMNNIFSLDTIEALTGPIARGDVHTVQQHIDALESPYVKNIYKSLGLQLVKISREKGNAEKKQLDEIENSLSSNQNNTK